MTELLHRVKIFVFQHAIREPRYLLLRAAQGLEGCWGPLQGNIGFGEKLETAIRREVIDETGILRSLDVIDLELHQHQSLGDEHIIEWTFGIRIPQHDVALRLDPKWAAFRWADFSRGYPLLELDDDRAALVRLHAMIRAA